MQLLKRCCNPEKACNFIFPTETLSKVMNFKKSLKSQSCLDQKFLFFHCGVIFDKLSKLGQISFVIPYYIEIKDSLYMSKIFVNLLESWYKMRKKLNTKI